MKAKFIPLTEFKAVRVNPRGEGELVELRKVDAAFYNKAPVKEELSLKGVISHLGSADDGLDEVEALLAGIDSFLVDNFISGVYLEEDEEAKNEIRKVLRLLDMVRDKIDTIQREVSISTNSLIKLN